LKLSLMLLTGQKCQEDLLLINKTNSIIKIDAWLNKANASIFFFNYDLHDFIQ
jgi:hypothetical protein